MGLATGNGCNMAKENERRKKKKERTLQTCAEFNESIEEIKRDTTIFLL